jgi:hypothetical protein
MKIGCSIFRSPRTTSIYTTMIPIYGGSMTTLKHHCANCDTKFRINYDNEEAESDPTWCPFCAEYIITDTEEDLDDDMDA